MWLSPLPCSVRRRRLPPSGHRGRRAWTGRRQAASIWAALAVVLTCFCIPCFPWHNVQCFSVKISYYEVYMERCYDLLEPKAKEIMALDNNLGNLQLKGLAWAPV
ncbi:hypothetical protein ZWY2020_052966 [Hordeum vulgare]|nr:hypothetical protein ZWY2020_052966 [Hordeum vulgare]